MLKGRMVIVAMQLKRGTSYSEAKQTGIDSGPGQGRIGGSARWWPQWSPIRRHP